MGRDIRLYDYLIHFIPFLVSIATTVRVVLYQQPQFSRQIIHFQNQINDFNYAIQTIPFYSEAIMHVIRIGLTVLYFGLITVRIRKYGDPTLSDIWNRLFLPVRINVFLVVSTFVVPIILKMGFKWAYSEYFMIVPTMIISTFLFFWHVLMSIRNISTTAITVDHSNTTTIATPQIATQVDILANVPEKLLSAITSIYIDKLYLNPMFGISDVAEKHMFDNQKFSLEFNKHLPFTFTSYVNYLRLKYHITHSNDKFSVEANILTAGFNSRASYYQWVKRKDNLDNVLAAYVEAIAAKNADR
jgi:hypothetical protein